VSKLFDVKNINCIISGGAKGVDTLARNYAIVNDVKLK
jgi:predicted Rossmann fold nucleotide-binding protein DprA/Smf involved in DNA uptake